MPSDLHKLLSDARDLIKEHGWVQNKFGSRSEGFCLVGALVKTNYRHKYRPGLEAEAASFLAEISGVGVLTWNDEPGRSKEQVLELLETAMEATK